MKHGAVGPFLGLWAALAVALGAAPTQASAFHDTTVHVEAGAWFPSLDAEARSSRLGVAGDLVSNDDIGLDDPDVVLQGGLTFRLAQRHTLRIDGFGFSIDGSRQTDRSFTFDGRTYPVSTPVSSEADVAFAGADYGFDLVHTGPVALGLNLGVRFVGAEASIEAPVVGKGKGELQTALPALGIVAIVHPFPVPLLSSLVLSGRVSGGTIGDRGSFIDAEGGIEWLPIPLLAIRIGYRYFHAEGEEDGDEAEVDLTGPYANLTLSF
ncbi:MAG TPA: hypothetical protein VHF87_02835 [Methylomirabilota bacterium]|jgi:hypothetical protein|nr:hypothetical protein [Methylomirabilota bacterium]